MNFRKLGLVLALVCILGFSPKVSQAKLIVGLSSVNVAFLPVYVSEDKGFFKDEGLDVLLVLFNAGATNLQALVGGDIQIIGERFRRNDWRAGGRVRYQEFLGHLQHHAVSALLPA
jgi:ABC-type nitrate/sulfonate/bicarbonate transport system substrate-binding protein